MCEERGCDFLAVGKTGLFGIQRKAVKDLVASIQGDDRMCVELGQLAGSDLAHFIMVIEGDWAFDRNGVSMTTGYSRAQYEGVMLSLQAEHGAIVMHTESVAETAETLLRLESWMQKSHHGSLQVRKKSRAAWGTPALKEFRIHWWQTFPGVSYGRAVMLDAHFGGRLPFEFTCTQDDLLACKGIGAVTAGKIWKALEQLEVAA